MDEVEAIDLGFLIYHWLELIKEKVDTISNKELIEVLYLLIGSNFFPMPLLKVYIRGSDYAPILLNIYIYIYLWTLIIDRSDLCSLE